MAWRRDEPEPVPAEQAFGALHHRRTCGPLAAVLKDDVPKPQARAGRPPRPGHGGHRSGPGRRYERLDDSCAEGGAGAARGRRGRLQHDRFLAAPGRCPPSTIPRRKEAIRPLRLRRTRGPRPGLFSPTTTGCRPTCGIAVPFRPPSAGFRPADRRRASRLDSAKRGRLGGNSRGGGRRRAAAHPRDGPRGPARPARRTAPGRGRPDIASATRSGSRPRRVRAIAEVLLGGDFYTGVDQDESKHDPAYDLTIKAFAWPMLLQAAGLAQKSGDKLNRRPSAARPWPAPPLKALRAQTASGGRAPCWMSSAVSKRSRVRARWTQRPGFPSSGGPRRPGGLPGRSMVRGGRLLSLPARDRPRFRARTPAVTNCTSPSTTTAPWVTTVPRWDNCRAATSWRCCSSTWPRWG